MACPCSSQWSRSCNAGGGGCCDQPLKSRRSMIQGSNHPRTARSAIGQETWGRCLFSSLIFFPRPYCINRNVCLWADSRQAGLLRLVGRVGAGVRGVIPAKREGAADQLPMSPHRFVAPDLILRPAQGVLDLFIALFDPHAQSIEPHHFLQAGSRQEAHLRPLRSGRRQIGEKARRWSGRAR
jgi:hypothetical protein